MSDMPREIKVWPDGDSGVMFKGDSRLHIAGDIYYHESEHAKLEAANRVLRKALDKIANCKQGDVVKYIQTVDALALDAIDTADEIMKESDDERA